MGKGIENNGLLKKTCAVCLATVLIICGLSSFVDTNFLVNSIDSLEKTTISSFEYEENDYGEITIKKFVGDETHVIIPEVIEGKTVTIIDNYCFEGSNIEQVVMPDSIVSIGWYAFSNCKNLKDIVLSEDLNEISPSAFENCDSMKIINLPSNVIEIGQGAFSKCYKLQNIEVHSDNIYFSSENGVLFNKNMTELICCPAGKKGTYTVPDSVERLANDAFSGCKELSEINISNVNRLGEEVDYFGYVLTGIFEGCDNLESINVASENKFYSSVDGVLFNGDRSEVIYYPRGKKDDCYVIPNGVIKIGSSVFGGIDWLSYITIPDSVRNIGASAFAGCDGLRYIEIPEGVKTISERAFKNCVNLKLIIMPKSVSYIGEYAFENFENKIFLGEYGSYAENYAKDDFSIDFISIDSVICEDGVYNVHCDSNERSYLIFEAPENGDYMVDINCDSYFKFDDGRGNKYNYLPSFNEVYNLKKNEFMCLTFSMNYVPFSSYESIDLNIEFSKISSVSETGKYENVEKGKFVFKAEQDDVYTFAFHSNDKFEIDYKNSDSQWKNADVIRSKDSYDSKISLRLHEGDLGIFLLKDIVTPVELQIDNYYDGGWYYLRDGNLVIECADDFYDNYKYSVFEYDIRDLINNAIISEKTSFIKKNVFYNLPNLKNVFIPKSVVSIEKSAFSYFYYDGDPQVSITFDDGIEKIMDYITIYGYSGSCAETFAKENNIPFIVVDALKDNDTNIEVAGRLEEGTELKVKELSVKEIKVDEKNKTVRACFDISLMNSENEVQPEMPVTVKIPYSGNFTNGEVYRINNDGSKDKMLSNYDGKYITFITDHFSKYAVVTDSGTAGDTNGDGSVDIADALMIARADAGLIQLDEMQFAVSDVNKDKSVDIADALMVARFDAGLITAF